MTIQAPYNQEAEEAVIGAVLANGSLMGLLAGALQPEDFFILRHRYIWEAMRSLYEQKQAIDALTVLAALKECKRDADVGGFATMTQLVNSAPFSSHVEAYADMVKRAAIRRRLLAASDKIKGLSLDTEKTVEEALDLSARALTEVQTEALRDENVSFYQEISDYYSLVERLMNNPNAVVGIPTGFTELDRMLLGLQAPDLLIIAGRPGMGKSSFQLSVAMNVMKTGKRVAMFTLEMSRRQLAQRAASLEAGINLKTLREGKLSPAEWGRFVKTMGEVSKLPFLLNEKGQLTPDQLRAQLYKWQAEHGKIDVVMVDYLQLMSGGKAYKPSDRVQEVGYISRELKSIAKEFNVPLLAAAQLSREVEKRGEKKGKPILSDLRDSGAIEQDADIVMFLYRDEVYNEATEFPNQADVIIAKHRNGATGTISLYFEKTLTKFMNAADRRVDLSHI